MTGSFIFGIVNFRAKEIGEVFKGVLFFGVYNKVSRCQGGQVNELICLSR